MRVLWLCNIMLPAIAKKLQLEASNKEGWLTGLAETVMAHREENGIELCVACPVPEGLLRERDVLELASETGYGKIRFYGFREDVSRPHIYDSRLEPAMKKILESCRPDVIHCFGTEYPHTLAVCRACPDKGRLLIGIQGLCALCADACMADLPGEVKNSVTFRDFVKRDSIRQQQEKFVLRGRFEREALELTGNITGRTAWDRFYAGRWNPKARYFQMNETLRPDFYEGRWRRENCVPHSVFASQGDIPLKGVHYLLKALPAVLQRYPDTHVFIAGADITQYGTWKQKLKLPAYGGYLRRLLRENDLWTRVTFLGRLDSRQMKEQYLKSHLYVCCSSIENSPNSLGEAMLLGMPCVSADVGGIPSMFSDGEDGILYGGFRNPGNEFYNMRDLKFSENKQLEQIAKRLSDAIIRMWDDEGKLEQYCENARKHAEKTHDREGNYARLTEIYASIIGRT